MPKIQLNVSVTVFLLFLALVNLSCLEAPNDLIPYSEIKGVVKNNYGEPLKDVQITTDPFTKTIITDATGEFKIIGIGSFIVKAVYSFNDKNYIVKNNYVATANSSNYEIIIDGFGEVKGTIKDSAGNLFEGVDVSILNRNTATNSLGEFSLKVPFGTYSIFVGAVEIGTNINVNSTPVLIDYELQPFTSMVFVKGSTFQLGGNSNNGEEPLHQVTLSDFYIGKYEVTQKEWVEIMGSNPSYFKGDNLPVENVSWNEVQSFILKLNQKTGIKYRLPTEAEWEYAARGGKNNATNIYSGSDIINEVGWYNANSLGKSNMVGLKKPNDFGIYDMTGNVWEWCQDWYGVYPSTPQTNPKGPDTGIYRVLRGGSWYNDDYLCRVTYRYSYNPDIKNDYIGFRLVR